MHRRTRRRPVRALMALALSPLALVGLMAPGATASTLVPTVAALDAVPAFVTNVTTGDTITIPTATTDEGLALPSYAIPLEINQTVPTLGYGVASAGGCWWYRADYVVKNAANRNLYEYWDEWQWCGDGSRITSLPYHMADVVPLNPIIRYGYRSWNNAPPGAQTLATHSKGHCYVGQGAASYNYYPRIDATLYPDGTIVGVFYYN